jgi:hypothetical protein
MPGAATEILKDDALFKLPNAVGTGISIPYGNMPLLLFYEIFGPSNKPCPT